MKLRKFALAPIAAAALMAFSLNASAATQSWILNIASTGSQGTGPWATVTATTVDANTIGVTVNLISPPTIGFVTTGGPHHAFAFNLADDGTPGIVGNLTPDGFVAGGSGINTPFGFFSNVIDWTGGPGGSNPSPGPLNFSVTDAGGLTLASFIASTGLDVGYRFSADLLVAGPNGNVTGNVAVGVPTPPIPEPETYAMLLAGLGLLGFVARRRRQGASG